MQGRVGPVSDWSERSTARSKRGTRGAVPFLLSETARPLRFAGTGITAGAIQLGLLAGLTRLGWDSLAANALAFLLAAQVNFLLSYTFTWRERRAQGSLARRWLLFHGSIAGMAALNMLVFALARSVLPALVASALGIACGSLGNYLSGDRLVFRPPRDARRLPNEAECVA